VPALDDFYLFPRLTGGSFYVGKNLELLSGATLRWNSDIKRYSKNQTQSASISDHRYQIGFAARAIVDPLYKPSGMVVKVQDLVRAFFSGATNAQRGKAVFAIGQQNWASNIDILKDNIGWRAIYTQLNVQPTWEAFYANKDGTVTSITDSGLKCDVPRLLQIVLNGINQTIQWYIDGVLAKTYSPAADDVGGQVAAGVRESVHWICANSSGVVGASFDYLMLGAPTVTVQYPDAA
jgi:hypothetical protein